MPPYLTCNQQLTKEKEQSYPEASRVTLEDFYVEDVQSSADDFSARSFQQKRISLLRAGEFNLRKWLSNCNELIEALLYRAGYNRAVLDLSDEGIMKSLGFYGPLSMTFKTTHPGTLG